MQAARLGGEAGTVAAGARLQAAVIARKRIAGAVRGGKGGDGGGPGSDVAADDTDVVVEVARGEIGEDRGISRNESLLLGSRAGCVAYDEEEVDFLVKAVPGVLLEGCAALTGAGSGLALGRGAVFRNGADGLEGLGGAGEGEDDGDR